MKKLYILLTILITGTACFALGMHSKTLWQLLKKNFSGKPAHPIESLQQSEQHFDDVWKLRRKNALDVDFNNIEKLQSLGYVTGSNPRPNKTGVTIYNPQKSYAGYNLFTSAHAPVAFIMDMEGNVLHKWEKNRDEVWPYLKNVDKDRGIRRCFRRVRLYENGDLLAIYDYTGIIKIDAHSNLLWAYDGLCHHDLDIDEQGNIYVLGRNRHETNPTAFKNSPPPDPIYWGEVEVFDDIITILNPDDGKLIERISILECFKNSSYISLLDGAKSKKSSAPLDLFHTNTISILDGQHAHRSSAFKRGNILVSFRNLSTIAIIDPTQKKIVWALSYAWRMQHQPEFLPNGNLLLFDNVVGTLLTLKDIKEAEISGKDLGEYFSRVIEFDPLTQEISWEYTGTETNRLFSLFMGSNQRLPNGNTLITESNNGRVIEVTKEKEIVWEFYNFYTIGDKNQYIAILPELIRLATNFPVKNFAHISKP